jgi:hypothetical protein
LKISLVNLDLQQQARCIDQDVALAAIDLLGAIEAVDPPFSVVWAD